MIKSIDYVKREENGAKVVREGQEVHVQLSGEVPEQPSSIAEHAKTLTPGSKWTVTWKQIIVSTDGTELPTRSFASIEPV